MVLLRHVVENLGDVVLLHSDGTVFRSKNIDSHMSLISDDSVIYKDCNYDKIRNLKLRLYKPKSKTSSSKLLIIVFIHGGGFCVGSCTWPGSHNCCLKLASRLNALVVAPDYRLAPEHRLPAAIEDIFTAIKWLQVQAVSKTVDEWFNEAEVGKVFILGDSSGGNLAHHLAVKLGGRGGSTELAPIVVRGYVLLAPFFGGEVRTNSEQGPSEKMLNLELLDRFWRLSLPVGENRDHPYANPFGPDSPSLEAVSLGPMLVAAGQKELLKDRAKDYERRLKAMEKKIDYKEFEGEEHGFFTDDPSSDAAKRFLKVVEEFIYENSI